MIKTFKMLEVKMYVPMCLWDVPSQMALVQHYRILGMEGEELERSILPGRAQGTTPGNSQPTRPCENPGLWFCSGPYPVGTWKLPGLQLTVLQRLSCRTVMSDLSLLPWLKSILI